MNLKEQLSDLDNSITGIEASIQNVKEVEFAMDLLVQNYFDYGFDFTKDKEQREKVAFAFFEIRNEIRLLNKVLRYSLEDAAETVNEADAIKEKLISYAQHQEQEKVRPNEINQ